jgi:hypothetical protein
MIFVSVYRALRHAYRHSWRSNRRGIKHIFSALLSGIEVHIFKL